MPALQEVASPEPRNRTTRVSGPSHVQQLSFASYMDGSDLAATDFSQYVLPQQLRQGQQDQPQGRTRGRNWAPGASSGGGALQATPADGNEVGDAAAPRLDHESSLIFPQARDSYVRQDLASPGRVGPPPPLYNSAPELQQPDSPSASFIRGDSDPAPASNITPAPASGSNPALASSSSPALASGGAASASGVPAASGVSAAASGRVPAAGSRGGSQRSSGGGGVAEGVDVRTGDPRDGALAYLEPLATNASLEPFRAGRHLSGSLVTTARNSAYSHEGSAHTPPEHAPPEHAPPEPSSAEDAQPGADVYSTLPLHGKVSKPACSRAGGPLGEGKVKGKGKGKGTAEGRGNAAAAVARERGSYVGSSASSSGHGDTVTPRFFRSATTSPTPQVATPVAKPAGPAAASAAAKPATTAAGPATGIAAGMAAGSAAAKPAATVVSAAASAGVVAGDCFSLTDAMLPHHPTLPRPSMRSDTAFVSHPGGVSPPSRPGTRNAGGPIAHAISPPTSRAGSNASSDYRYRSSPCKLQCNKCRSLAY